MTDEYNGWTNRETWAVALHLNNEQELQEEALRVAAESRYQDGDELKTLVEDWLADLVECGNEQAYNVLTDIGSLWRVNWREIQATFAEDAKELAS